MNKIDLRNTKKIIHNGEEVRKMYLGNNLIYMKEESLSIIYTVNDVLNIHNYLPKGVTILEQKLKGNKMEMTVGEGNITFKVNSGITTIEKLKHRQLSSCARMFYNSPNLRKINLEEFDTEDVTSFREMFAYCNALNEVNMKGLKTEKVTDMYGCFYACDFRILDLSGFKTEKVTNMASLFGQCIYLEEVVLSSFDTSNVTNMTFMFLECNALRTLDIRNFDTRNIKNKLNVRGMFTGVPPTCKIYVGKNWTLTEKETEFEGRFIRV